ncbi:MAG: hypothetical protein E6K91_08430 [Thaumarchaeota archaeon]|nr:MAG: hypothetical protein E6K91_08430 [Nitrososphaerota archaeon]
MKLVFLLIVLTISPIFIQMSLASDSNFVTGKYTLICKDNYYDITYNVANATVSSFTAHSNQDMRFDIQNSNNGHIIVDIPKKLVNESPPWNPIGTTVTIDGKFLDARQGMGNSTDRIMDIILWVTLLTELWILF